MPTAYTHYWQREKLDKADAPHLSTKAFSSKFRERGVSAGDRVFFVSYAQKRPFLVGAITVAADPVELDEGGERIDAVPGSGSVMDFERPIPLEIARQIIRLETGEGWKFVNPELLDSQTLRGVQRIHPDSAALLDSLLGVTSAVAYDAAPRPAVRTFTVHPLSNEYLYPDEVPAANEYHEGAVTQVLVNRYERDPAARRACLEEYGSVCIICDFDFEEWYGKLGAGFIHVHHIVPISQLGRSYRVDPIKDLVPVCPNCHAMLHRTDPPMPVSHLAQLYDHHAQIITQQEGQ